MPKAALGLHITPRRLTAVRMAGGFKGAAVSAVRTNAINGQGLKEAISELGVSHEDGVTASLGAGSVFQRSLEVAFADKNRALRAAPLEAEETLPLPLEKIVTHSHVLEKKSTSSRVLVVAAPMDRVEKRLSSLAEAGVEPLTLDADPSALATVATAALSTTEGAVVVDLDGDDSQAVVMSAHGSEKFLSLSFTANSPLMIDELERFLSSGDELEVTPKIIYLCGPDAVNADLQKIADGVGLPVELLPYPKKAAGPKPADAPPWPTWAVALGLALGEMSPRQYPHVNLLTGPFARGGGQRQWRGKAIAAGVAAALLLMVWGATGWVESSNKEQKLQALNSTIQTLFKQALPDVSRMENPVVQVSQRNAELEERTKSLGSLLNREVSPLRALREISERVPKDITVEFRDFNAEEDRVRIEGETTSFDAIDKIQASLEGYPWFSSVKVSDAKAGVTQGKVIFKLTIELGPPAES